MELSIVKHLKQVLLLDFNSSRIEWCNGRGAGRRANTTSESSELVHSSIFLDTRQIKNAALIGGVAGASGFGLIAVIALAVLFVKYRIVRRSMNRGSLRHTGEANEQEKCLHSGDDMIEREDSF